MLLALPGDPQKAAYSQTATLPLRPASHDTWTIATLLVMYKLFGVNGKKRAQKIGILVQRGCDQDTQPLSVSGRYLSSNVQEDILRTRWQLQERRGAPNK